MDLVGPLPPTKKGHTWIVTWVDRTSKMIVAAAAADGQMTSEKLTLMTFKEICCRFGLPLNLIMDNDIKFVSSLWQSLWQLCGTKLRFTSSYNPQSDPAERANHQLLEALRAAVATVVQYDEWDEALPHVTFGLNTHVSSATKVTPFEFAHGFKARVPLTLGLTVDTTTTDVPRDKKAVSLAQQIANRHNATSDQMVAAQDRLGHLLEQRSTPSTVAVGDKVWLDSKHTPVDIPYKLTARWFGPFEVTSVQGAQVTLDLPETFGKANRRVNIRRLKFFEACDECFGAADERPTPLQGHAGVTRYEIKRISNARVHKGQQELWVEWKGYDQSHNCWVHRDVLTADVTALVRAFDTRPSSFKACAAAPKQATTGYKTQVPSADLERRQGLRARV